MVFDLKHDHSDKICLECNREFTGIITNCPHDNALLFARVQDPFVGTTLAGNYQIQSVIGHGGMGVVYKARHELMDRIVAIKMLQAQLISDSMSVKRFQQESKAASRINHPHVITVYDFGISPTGQPYIVMDYLEGISLADVIKNDGQVSVERSIRIIGQSCEALDHAHKQGVVHRDLKPTNIVLIKYDDEDDFVKVVDFGVAKLMGTGADGQRLTQAGEVCGSPVYMSPEQCMGMELDPRSDIYSMGIVIYETLTGKLPILGKTMVDTMSKHISEMPPTFKESRPDLYIPERLESVVFKALAKDPNERHQTMEELRQDLELAIPRPGKSQVLRTSGPQVSPWETIKQSLKSLPVSAWVGIGIAILVAGFATVAAVMHKPAPPVPTQTITHPIPTTPTNPPATTIKPPTQPTVAPPTVQTEAPGEGPHHTAAGPEPGEKGAGDQTPRYATHPSAVSTRQAYSTADAKHAQKAHKPPRHPAYSASTSSTPHHAAPSGGANPWQDLRKERSY